MELRSTSLRVLAILVVVGAGKEDVLGGAGLGAASGGASVLESESESEVDEASSVVGLPGR